MTTNALRKIRTPSGRIVSGSPSRGSSTAFDGTPLVYKTGPNAGQQRQEFLIYLAVSKRARGIDEFLSRLHQVARALPGAVPSQAPDGSGGNVILKVVDGDSTNCPKGSETPYNKKPGYAGCWVFRMKSGFPIQSLEYVDGQTREILPGDTQIKCGDYVDAVIDVVGNTSQTLSLFLQPRAVRRLGFGQEIGGFDATSAFSPEAPELPQGAQAAPLGPELPVEDDVPTFSTTTMPSQIPGGVQIVAPRAPYPAAPAPAPVPEFLNPAAPPPPALEEQKYIAQGRVFTETQLRAAGYTDENLKTLVPA